MSLCLMSFLKLCSLPAASAWVLELPAWKTLNQSFEPNFSGLSSKRQAQGIQSPVLLASSGKTYTWYTDRHAGKHTYT